VLCVCGPVCHRLVSHIDCTCSIYDEDLSEVTWSDVAGRIGLNLEVGVRRRRGGGGLQRMRAVIMREGCHVCLRWPSRSGLLLVVDRTCY
jgi:hypothetical protein